MVVFTTHWYHTQTSKGALPKGHSCTSEGEGGYSVKCGVEPFFPISKEVDIKVE